MALHPLVEGFADVAEVYERGRPGYPEAAIAAIGLAPGARVADVGAGTGKLTRALVAAGYGVVAVEPLDGMRARLTAELPGVEALAGTAEALPLPDASVDAIAVGEAFHWFDPARAAPELARVLRPGGVLAVLGNRAPTGGTPPEWERALGALIGELRPAQHPGVAGDGAAHRTAFDATGVFTPLTLSEFSNTFSTDRDGLLAGVASHSFIGLLEPAARGELLARADALLREHRIDRVDVALTTTLRTARVA